MNSDPETGGPRLWQNKEGDWKANFEVNMNSFLFSPSKGNGGDKERQNNDEVDAAFPPEKSTTAAEKKSAQPPEPDEPNF